MVSIGTFSENTTEWTPLKIGASGQSYRLGPGAVEMARSNTIASLRRTFATSPMADRKLEKSSSEASSPTNTRSGPRGSNKSSSANESSGLDWQFLNFSHPEEAKTTQHRKKVRSHVTKQQHHREQQAAAKKAKSYQADGEPAEPPPQRSHEATFPSTQPSSSQMPGPLRTFTESSQPASQSPSPAPSPTTYSPSSHLDPTDIYPAEWHAWIPRIMDHYLSLMSIDIPEVDDATSNALLRTIFFPFVFTDLAPLHAVMLLAASHYIRVRGSRSYAIDLLQLRGMAIREINSALADDVRGTSDQVIAAVSHMASYESLFGDRAICNTHMQGLTRMVSLRGGLPALGLDGLLERMLLWIDSNVSHIINTHQYFDKSAFPPSAPHVGHPSPDPMNFAGGGLSRQPPG